MSRSLEGCLCAVAWLSRWGALVRGLVSQHGQSFRGALFQSTSSAPTSRVRGTAKARAGAKREAPPEEPDSWRVAAPKRKPKPGRRSHGGPWSARRETGQGLKRRRRAAWPPLTGEHRKKFGAANDVS